MLVDILKLNQLQCNQRSVKMVLPAAFLVPALWSAGSAAVTGIASYFIFHTPASGSGTKTTGEIQNNVHLAVQENNNQNATLVLLVATLVAIKIFEVTIYMINTTRRNMKKKYIKRYEPAERPAVQNV